MRLADKGPIKPPPTLDGPAAVAMATILSWTEVIAAAHWALLRPGEIDGVDFYFGEHELGHIHLDAVVHLATPPELGHPLAGHGLAKRYPYSGAAYDGWVVYRIRSAEDAVHAAWLFRIAYDRLRGISMPELLQRISDKTAGARVQA